MSSGSKSFNLPPRSPDQLNLLLAPTGSVACIKIPTLIHRLSRSLTPSGRPKFNIILIPSHTAIKFFDVESVRGLCTLFTDSHEWTTSTSSTPSSSPSGTRDEDVDDDRGTFTEGCSQCRDASGRSISGGERQGNWTRGDEILHIELRRWTDTLLVAPLSAHSLASIVAGLCDTLLLEVIRAWDYADPNETLENVDDAVRRGRGQDKVAGETQTQMETETETQTQTETETEQRGSGNLNVSRRKNLVAAPAMNSAMYKHPLTAHHLSTLHHLLGFHVLGPVSKVLACGDVGIGGMVEVERLVDWLEEDWRSRFT